MESENKYTVIRIKELRSLKSDLDEAIGLLEEAHTMLTQAITLDNTPEDIKTFLTKLEANK